MTTEWIGVLVTFGLTVLLAISLGKYLARVFKGESNSVDFMRPLERLNQLMDEDTEGPLLGLFGPVKVNVLKLNVVLDKL